MKRYICLLLVTVIACLSLVACDTTPNYPENGDSNDDLMVNNDNDLTIDDNGAENDNDQEATQPEVRPMPDFASMSSPLLDGRVIQGDFSTLVIYGDEGFGGPETMWFDAGFALHRFGAGISEPFGAGIIGLEALEAWMYWLFSDPNGPWQQGESVDPNTRLYIDHFGLTIEDFVRAVEASEYMEGRTIAESDILVARANELEELIFQYGQRGMHAEMHEIHSYMSENGYFVWMGAWTLAEIEKFFVDCIYELWNHFPGYGVIMNGQVYTPAWLIQNAEYAILELDIDVADIQRVIDRASTHCALRYQVAIAQNAMEMAQAAR